MGRKAKATRENVTAAIRQLLVTDGPEASISAHAIRKIINGGSLGTITSLINSLRSENPEIFTVAAKSEIGGFTTIYDYVADLKVRLDVISHYLREAEANTTRDNHTISSDIEKQILESKIVLLEKTVLEKDDEIAKLWEKIKILESLVVDTPESHDKKTELPDDLGSPEIQKISTSLALSPEDDREKSEPSISDSNEAPEQIEEALATKQKPIKSKPGKDGASSTQLSFL